MWRANIRKLFIKGENKELNLKVFNGIPEAPADGEQYVRKDRFWRKLQGAIELDDTVTEGSENAVKSSGIWAFVTTQIDAVKNWATNLFLKKSDEDKGSAAVEGHEQEYDHDEFLTDNDFNSDQFELDPSDKVTLKEGGLPIYVDNTTITGAGTQNDPYNVAADLGNASKRVATWVAEDNETNKVIFDYWDNNDPIEMIDGLHLIFIIKYNTLDGNYNDTSNRCFLRWVENHKFQRIDNAGTSFDIQSLSGELGEKLTTIEIRVLNKKVFARVVEGINDKAQTVREFRSQQDFTTLTGMSINQRTGITFKAGNTIILYEL